MINIYGSIISFQNSATPIMEGIVDLHNLIFFYLIMIFVFVIWIFVYILNNFYVLPTILNIIAKRKYIKNYTLIKPYFLKNYLNFLYDYLDLKINFPNFDELLYKNYCKAIKNESMNQQINLLKTKEILENTKLEIIWTLIPSFILILIAIPSFSLLYAMDEIVDPKLTVKAIGYQWFWVYEYAQNYNKYNFEYLTDILGYNYSLIKDSLIYDSIMISDEELPLGYHRLLDVDKQLILPTNIHTRILVTAADVLHSWAIPSLGIKIDAVPGRINQVGIFLKRQGVFYGQCSELCGVNHGFMPIAIKAVDYKEFLKWYEQSQIIWN